MRRRLRGGNASGQAPSSAGQPKSIPARHSARQKKPAHTAYLAARITAHEPSRFTNRGTRGARPVQGAARRVVPQRRRYGGGAGTPTPTKTSTRTSHGPAGARATAKRTSRFPAAVTRNREAPPKTHGPESRHAGTSHSSAQQLASGWSGRARHASGSRRCARSGR